MIAGIVDQAGIFVAALGVDHQRRFLLQHFGEADDGVERRAQFVAHGGEEAALGGIGALGLGAGVFKRLLLQLAPGDVAQHRDDFATAVGAGIGAGLLERPAAHLDPDEFRHRGGRLRRRRRAARGTPPNGFRPTPRRRRAPSDRRADRRHGRGRTSRGRGIRQCAAPNSDSPAGDTNNTAPSRPCRVIDVGHVARQQAVAVLLGVKQPEAGARQRLGAEREPGRIKRRRYDAERGERRMRARTLAPARAVRRRAAPGARRRRARASTRSQRRGARPTAPPRAARQRARSRRMRRCRRSRRPPPSPARSAPATTARARSRSGRCATENKR